MTPFLFAFTGRQNRLTYVFRLVLTALSIGIIQGVSFVLGDWTYKGIVLGIVIAAAVANYFSAVAKRLQDTGMNPLLGLFLFYLAPPIIVVAVNLMLISPIMLLTLGEFVEMVLNGSVWLSVVGTIGSVFISLAGLLLAAGQAYILLWPGEKSANEFGDRPSFGIGETRLAPL